VIRLRRITWRSHGTPPEFPEWAERADLMRWLEQRGARVEAWMLGWNVRWPA
jgi:hypothetical protein